MSLPADRYCDKCGQNHTLPTCPPLSTAGVLTLAGPKVCMHCGESCIAMCPHCTRYVHQNFQVDGKNCGGRHESVCPLSAGDRSP